jgi:hypothetical protein
MRTDGMFARDRRDIIHDERLRRSGSRGKSQKKNGGPKDRRLNLEL